jgi:hypothetical protein
MAVAVGLVIFAAVLACISLVELPARRGPPRICVVDWKIWEIFIVTGITAV